jgi:hypothetical protein
MSAWAWPTLEEQRQVIDPLVGPLHLRVDDTAALEGIGNMREFTEASARARRLPKSTVNDITRAMHRHLEETHWMLMNAAFRQ